MSSIVNFLTANYYFIILLVILLFVLWLFMLTYLILRNSRFYQRIFQGAKGRLLEEVLLKFSQDLGEINGQIKKQGELINKLQDEFRSCFQKSAVVRFNPYKDTGGDQSFVISLLDKNDSGFVISSLHGRSGTRLYAKSVKRGENEGRLLSKEEKKAIFMAQQEYKQRKNKNEN